MKKPEKTRVKGMLPLGCLPRWGGEGVTLLAVAEYKQMIRKIGFQQSQKNKKRNFPTFRPSNT